MLWRMLLVCFGLFLLPATALASPPMPPTIVLIVCKTVVVAPQDANDKYTGHENRDWDYDHGMMVCRRNEVQVYDATVDQGADPVPFSTAQCMRSAIMLGVSWNMQNRSSAYRFWRAACPVPIKNAGPDGVQGTRDDQIVGWKLPECGHRDTVKCETDTVI